MKSSNIKKTLLKRALAVTLACCMVFPQDVSAFADILPFFSPETEYQQTAEPVQETGNEYPYDENPAAEQDAEDKTDERMQDVVLEDNEKNADELLPTDNTEESGDNIGRFTIAQDSMDYFESYETKNGILYLKVKAEGDIFVRNVYYSSDSIPSAGDKNDYYLRRLPGDIFFLDTASFNPEAEYYIHAQVSENNQYVVTADETINCSATNAEVTQGDTVTFTLNQDELEDNILRIPVIETTDTEIPLIDRDALYESPNMEVSFVMPGGNVYLSSYEAEYQVLQTRETEAAAETNAFMNERSNGETTSNDILLNLAEASTNSGASEPYASIKKSAVWTDIDHGLADITISVETNPVEKEKTLSVAKPLDIIIAMDQSDSVELSKYYVDDGYDGPEVLSPCCAKGHYYYLRTTKSRWDYYEINTFEGQIWGRKVENPQNIGGSDVDYYGPGNTEAKRLDAGSDAIYHFKRSSWADKDIKGENSYWAEHDWKNESFQAVAKVIKRTMDEGGKTFDHHIQLYHVAYNASDPSNPTLLNGNFNFGSNKGKYRVPVMSPWWDNVHWATSATGEQWAYTMPSGYVSGMKAYLEYKRLNATAASVCGQAETEKTPTQRENSTAGGRTQVAKKGTKITVTYDGQSYTDTVDRYRLDGGLFNTKGQEISGLDYEFIKALDKKYPIYTNVNTPDYTFRQKFFNSGQPLWIYKNVPVSNPYEDDATHLSGKKYYLTRNEVEALYPALKTDDHKDDVDYNSYYKGARSSYWIFGQAAGGTGGFPRFNNNSSALAYGIDKYGIYDRTPSKENDGCVSRFDAMCASTLYAISQIDTTVANTSGAFGKIRLAFWTFAGDGNTGKGWTNYKNLDNNIKVTTNETGALHKLFMVGESKTGAATSAPPADLATDTSNMITASAHAAGTQFKDLGISNLCGFVKMGYRDANGNALAYKALKKMVAGNKAVGGTNFWPSYMLAYQMFNARSKDRKTTANGKFVLITDGSDSYVYGNNRKYNETRATHYAATTYASKMKSFNKTKLDMDGDGTKETAQKKIYLYACAVNVPQSDYVEYLQEKLISSKNYFISVNVAQSSGSTTYETGGENSPLAKKLLSSVLSDSSAQEEIWEATSKVVTDEVSGYFSIQSCDTECGTATFSGQNVSWSIPDKNKSGTMVIHVKLNDTYRLNTYGANKMYPTNADSASKGIVCKMNYKSHHTTLVDGDVTAEDDTDKVVDAPTPSLKYGIMKMTASKTWGTLQNPWNATPSETFTLRRTLAGEVEDMGTITATAGTLAADKNTSVYSGELNRNYHEAQSPVEVPILWYDNAGNTASFEIVKGAMPGGYYQSAYTTTWSADGSWAAVAVNAVNNQKAIKIKVTKKNLVSGEPLAGFQYTVYGSNNGTRGSYGDTYATITTNANGYGEATLYYNTRNGGHFLIKETKVGNTAYTLDTTTKQFDIDPAGAALQDAGWFTNNNSADTFYNVPKSIDLYLYKRNIARTQEPVHGAEFKVEQYKKATNTWVPYGVNASGQVTENAAEQVKVTEVDTATGKYHASHKLYFTESNQGKFRMIESKTPVGFVKDTTPIYGDVDTSEGSAAVQVRYAVYDGRGTGNFNNTNASAVYYNRPKSIKPYLNKISMVNSEAVNKATFAVFAYNTATGAYEPYYVKITNGTQQVVYPGEADATAANIVKLKYDATTKRYDTVGGAKLWFTNRNGGKFIIKEIDDINKIDSGTQDGYCIDYNADKSDLNAYPCDIDTAEDSPEEQTKNITNHGNPNSFENLAKRAIVYLSKINDWTKKEVRNAVFTVYEWNNQTQKYEPYHAKTTVKNGLYYGDVYNTAYGNSDKANANNLVEMRYSEALGKYVCTTAESTAAGKHEYLWYTQNNLGKFMVIETKTPDQYYGDWAIDNPDENSTDDDRMKYYINIDTRPSSKDEQEFTIHNHDELQQDINELERRFINVEIRAEINITKTGPVPTGTVTNEKGNQDVIYETKGLPGAWYIVRAVDDYESTENGEHGIINYPERGIHHKDAESTLAYARNAVVTEGTDESFLKKNGNTYLKKIADLDLSAYEEIADDNGHVTFVYTLDEQDRKSYTVVTGSEADVLKNYEALPYLSMATLDVVNKTLTLTDPDGNKEVITKVLVTDNDGKCQLKEIPLGTYEILEVKAPLGYVRNEETSTATLRFVCHNDWTKVVSKSVGYYNKKQDLNPNDPPEPPAPPTNNPSIRVTKNANKHVFRPGETVTYHVTVTNTGDTELENVTLTDVMDGNQDTKRTVGTIDLLKEGETQEFEYDYEIPADKPKNSVINNVVTAVGTSPEERGTVKNGEISLDYCIPSQEVTDNDVEKVKVVGNDITVVKNADKKSYVPGETITYTIDVVNTADRTLYDVNVTDVFTSNGVDTRDLKYLDSDMPDRMYETAEGLLFIKYLLPGDDAQLRYQYTIPEDFMEREITNKVHVDGEDRRTDEPNIMLVKSLSYGQHIGSYVHAPGDLVDYYMTVTNNGKVDLYDVVVEDSLNGTWVDDNHIGDLAVGESKVLRYQYSVPGDTPDGTKIPNTANVIGKADIVDEDGNKKVQEVTDEDDEEIIIKVDTHEFVPHISIKKTVVGNYILNPGETAIYQLVITNDGNMDLVNCMLEDDFLGFENCEWIEGSAAIGNMKVGEVLTYRYSYKTDPTLEDDTKIPNHVIVRGNAINPDTGKPMPVSDDDDAWIKVRKSGTVEDEDTEIVYVKNPKIKVKKVADKNTYKVGETVDFTITVTNVGNCDLTNVKLTDSRTDGIFGEKTGMIIKDNVVECGDLAIGESKDIHYYYVVKPEDKGTFINNVVLAEGDTIPEHEDETPIRVRDRDTEQVNCALNIGVKKVGLTEDGIEVPVEGAKFGLYALENITNIFNETVIPKDTLIEVQYTQENGYAYFETDLPLGDYYVKELEAPKGYYASDGIVYLRGEVFKNQDQITEVCIGGVIKNIQTEVLITKHDDMTMVEIDGASLSILDENSDVVDAWITTDTHGRGYSIKGLEPGKTYRLVENMPREGYVREFIRCFTRGALLDVKHELTGVTFTMPVVTTHSDNDENSPTYMDIIKESIPETGRIQVTDTFTVGDVRMYKTGELLESWTWVEKLRSLIKSTFNYITGGLEDVEFTVYAAEDIVHPDGKTGTIYKQGEVVKQNVKAIKSDAIGVTDASGKVTFTGLYLGKYYIQETRGAAGHLENKEPIYFELVADDGEARVVYLNEELTLHNKRQPVDIKLTKISSYDNEVKLPGAKFGIYAAEDIKNLFKTVIVKKDTLLETSVSDENGLVTFESDFPHGKYYIMELEAPAGYKLSDAVHEVDLTAQNSTDEVQNFSKTIENEPEEPEEPDVHKKAPKTASAGKTIKYTIDSIKNNALFDAENFVVVDTLPADVYMTELYTGTYSHKLAMDVYYQTNLNSDWREWQKGISTDEITNIKVDTLGLAQNEYITSFMMDFGTVPAKFRLIKNAYYYVTIGEDAVKGQEFINDIKLTCDILGVKYEANSETLTVIPDIPEIPDVPDDTIGNEFPTFENEIVTTTITKVTETKYNPAKKFTLTPKAAKTGDEGDLTGIIILIIVCAVVICLILFRKQIFGTLSKAKEKQKVPKKVSEEPMQDILKELEKSKKRAEEKNNKQ